MRDAVLLSIKPCYVAMMRTGRKTVELRRRFPAGARGKKIFVYASSPEQKIGGFFEAADIVRLPLSSLWKATCRVSCLSPEAFDTYYQGTAKGAAIFFNRFISFEQPCPLSMLGMQRPPQSYVYISAQQAQLLETAGLGSGMEPLGK